LIDDKVEDDDDDDEAEDEVSLSDDMTRSWTVLAESGPGERDE
jgi:hypothetical protein